MGEVSVVRLGTLPFALMQGGIIYYVTPFLTPPAHATAFSLTGVFFSDSGEYRDPKKPIIEIPPQCHMTSTSAAATLVNIANDLMNAERTVHLPLTLTVQPPYIGREEGGAAGKLITPKQVLTESPPKSHVLSNLSFELSQLDDSILLALFLARQRWLGDKSAYAPYIRTLPGVTSEFTLKEWEEVVSRMEVGFL